MGAIEILKKEGNKIPKVFWALPGNQIPAALKEKTKGIDAYDSIFASREEVGDFGGVELQEGDYNDCAVLCYSSGTVSLLRCLAWAFFDLEISFQTGLAKGVILLGRILPLPKS